MSGLGGLQSEGADVSGVGKNDREGLEGEKRGFCFCGTAVWFGSLHS